MSNWNNNSFLTDYTGGDDLSNGSANLNIRNVTIQSLQKNMPIKTDDTKKLVSTLLSISDTAGLQQELDKAIKNPLESDLQATGFNIQSVGDLSMIKKPTAPSAPTGELLLYANIDETLHYTTSGGQDLGLVSNPVQYEIDMNSRGITNLLGGTEPTDAINYNQLVSSSSNLQGQIDQNTTDIATNVIGINNNATGIALNMTFKGSWVQQTYDSQDVVTQDSWLMIANKETTDRAAPQPIGDELYVYGLDDLIQKQETTKSLLFGQRYTSGDNVYLRGFRVYTIIGNRYNIYAVSDPLGDKVVTTLLSFEASTDGWQEVNNNLLIKKNTLFDLVCIVSEPDPLPTQVSTNYNYLQPPQDGTLPLSGEIIQSNKSPSSMLISVTDANLNDRTALLAGLTSGDIIDGGGQRWSIQNITNNTTYFTIVIAPASQGLISPTQPQEFIFETVIATPISYHEDTDYWISNPNILGLISLLGEYDTVSVNNNQYGLDLQVQRVNLSEDWDPLSFSGTSSGGNGGGGTQGNSVNTGLLQGGVVGIDTITTNFTITAGNGNIFDGSSLKTVSWDNLIVPFPTGETDVYVGINDEGGVFIQNAIFTEEQQRDYIFLGEVLSLDTLNVERVLSYPTFLDWGINQLRDFAEAINIFNISGNVFTAGTTALTINKNSGKIFRFGANYENSSKNPSDVFLIQSLETNFTYAKQDSLIPPVNGTNLIVPGSYDNGGVITAIPGSANQATIQRIYVSLTGDVYIFYGQNIYININEALSLLATDSFVNNFDFSVSLLRGYLIIRKGATVLSDPADAVFVEADKFGGIPAGITSTSSVATLQSVYNNSTPSEILLNSTNGALTLQQGADRLDSDANLEIQNIAGDVTFSVAGNGLTYIGETGSDYALPNTRGTEGQVLTEANGTGLVVWADIPRNSYLYQGVLSDGSGFLSNGFDNNKDVIVTYLNSSTPYYVRLETQIQSFNSSTDSVATCQLLQSNNSWMPIMETFQNNVEGSASGTYLNASPDVGFDNTPLGLVNAHVVQNGTNDGIVFRMICNTTVNPGQKIMTRATCVYQTSTPPT